MGLLTRIRESIADAFSSLAKTIRGPTRKIPPEAEVLEPLPPISRGYRVMWKATARVRGTRRAEDRSGISYVDDVDNPKAAENRIYNALDSSYVSGEDIYYRISSVVASPIRDDEEPDYFDSVEDYEVMEDRDVDTDS